MTAPAPPPVAYFPNVGLGILSWRAHRTLRRTLQTLADADMFSLFGESLQSQFRTVRLLMMAIRGDVPILLIANAVRFEGTAANDDSIFPHNRRRLHQD